MLPSDVIVREYILDNGTSPFQKWFNKLNAQSAAKVAVALSRIEAGKFSNIKWFKGIGEYKINWGPGYRIYFAKDGDQLIILFGGGTKRTQRKDIEKAIQLHKEYKNRKQKL